MNQPTATPVTAPGLLSNTILAQVWRDPEIAPHVQSMSSVTHAADGDYAAVTLVPDERSRAHADRITTRIKALAPRTTTIYTSGFGKNPPVLYVHDLTAGQ